MYKGQVWVELNTRYFPHSTINNRGAFLSLFSLMLGLGILSCYCLGSLLYWRYVASIPPPLYLLLFCGLSRVPESPLWLLGHRGSKAAGQSLAWLRNSEDVGEELELIQQTMENQNRGLTMKEALSNLSRSDVRTPFLLIITNFGLVNFSGPPIMVFYAVEILQSDSVNKGKLQLMN